MKSKRNFKRKKLSTGDLEQKVFRLFLRSPKKRFNASTLSKKLKGKNSKDAVKKPRRNTLRKSTREK